MFVSPCAFREETTADWSSQPGMMRGPAAAMLQRSMSQVGIQRADWFYTAMVKYNCPKNKPTPADVRWNWAAFDNEIRTIKPKIIVCLGKQVFDYLSGLKFNMKEIQGGFFYSEEYDCQIYPMDNLLMPLLKPERIERLIVDLRAVREELDRVRGQGRPRVETDYRMIVNSSELRDLMDELKELQSRDLLPHLAIDCEWQGQTAWSGQLRSFQIAWAVGKGAFIKLMDTDLSYSFDVDLQGIHDIIAPVFDNPRTEFVGHNFAADAVWLRNHLGIETYRRCGFDTMYAQHTVDETSDLKLERLAVRYTDLGRYDVPLLMWKKRNKATVDESEGYGRIPDSVLASYGVCDVDTPLRAMRPLMGELFRQGLWRYYKNVLLPFVTDGFVEMMECGLPINQDYLSEMRDVFNRNKQRLIDRFRMDLQAEANEHLRGVLEQFLPDDWADTMADFENRRRQIYEVGGGTKEVAEWVDALANRFKGIIGTENIPEYYPIFRHWIEASEFNVDSTDQLQRWLFEVKKFEPLKTTKKDGIQMAWEKVKQYPEEKRTEFSPAVDKQTIHVLADRDPMVGRIEELKSVSSIVKSFLRPPDSEGNEKGMHKWIQPDGYIHTNFALTETARPRTWNPNILNWPKSIAKPIETAFQRLNDEDPSNAHQPVSLRSNVQAAPGYAIVEMDLKTAEVVALAYISGDESMINVLTEGDTQFALRKDDPKGDKPVRIGFNQNAEYPDSEKTADLLITTQDDPELQRHPDGSLVHPKRDLHWEMTEEVYRKPRERLSKDRDRGGVGKTGNFSIPYGASPTLLERMIEVQTGSKPEEGIGQRIIDRYNTRYPIAAAFLRWMEGQVENPGWYRSMSGRIRHFKFTEIVDLEGVSDKLKESIRNPLIRQARNFPIQEIVAATTAHAQLKFIEQRRHHGLNRSRVMILLYDAIALHAPLEELSGAVPLLKSCLTDQCQWSVNGRTLQFETDTDIMFRWGVKPSKEEKDLLAKHIKI